MAIPAKINQVGYRLDNKYFPQLFYLTRIFEYMKNNVSKLSIGGSLLTVMILASGCAEQTQNLQSINQTLGTAQRTVDYANTAAQAPQTSKRALKDAGQEMIRQNQTVQEASQTVDSTRTLINSVKKLGQTATE